jgi:hypothetical protein
MASIRTKGKTLSAIPVDDNKAVGTVSLNELEHFGIKSPAFMAKTSEKQLEKQDLPFKKLRQIVQRVWDKSRHTRADLYKVYIGRLYDSTVLGDTPPITLYVPELGTPGDQVIEFAYNAPVIAIDGETQLEARFRLRDENEETGDMPFAVTMHHGISEDHAMKILHDYNHYAKPIPESKLGTKNIDGPMSIAIHDAIKQAGMAQSDLNLTGSIANKKTIAAFNQAMAFIAGYAAGPMALKRTATSWYSGLNSAGNAAINGTCVPSLSDLFVTASKRKEIGSAQPMLWQVAGVLAGEGHKPSTVNWDAALQTYVATSPKQAGKSKVSDRLQAVYDAMAS